MKITFDTQKQLEKSVGLRLPRIWRIWHVRVVEAAADPLYLYKNIVVVRCPWFTVSLAYGKR